MEGTGTLADLPAEDTQPLADTAAVAAYFRVPQNTVKRWRAQGTGPAWCRVGRHVRYRWSDVHAWVEQRKSAGDVA